jgi:hypothetical protein
MTGHLKHVPSEDTVEYRDFIVVLLAIASTKFGDHRAVGPVAITQSDVLSNAGSLRMVNR